ncbi:twin-arginine translocase subunit TatC [Macrococcus armenti]|uniref:Sec-independent protein translocase protein TatC n=1 Tax=Macrococcus armenti TaxID=2875764 RepID=A0ABY3ZTL3_9STAP|nr:twin-arginine translocase subunit TatC [Macrococcus armenti]UOB20254.1 twin-arginine translocase subunit TatC [Macrococcus armenti]
MDKDNLTIVEHLEELRARLMVVGYFLIAGMFIGFIFGKPVTKFLTVTDVPKGIALNYFKVSDPLSIYLSVIMIIAIIIISPVILYQLWAFISPGLHPQERRATLAYIPFCIILFFAGMSFGYFILFPYFINFSLALASDMGLHQQIGVTQYFGEMMKITMPFGFVFQLPILLLFLTRLGVVNPIFLKKNRKYAYFILMVIAAIIAPPDTMTYIIFVLPMVLLYEFSIQISKIGYRQYLKGEQKLIEEELEK